MHRTSTKPEKNDQNYTISDKHGFVEAVAKFNYFGYVIAFSTAGYKSDEPNNKVSLYNYDNVHVGDFNSVEQAIEYIQKEQKRQYDLDGPN